MFFFLLSGLKILATFVRFCSEMMRIQLFPIVLVSALLALVWGCSSSSHPHPAADARVKIVESEEGFRLMKDGLPFQVRGAAGSQYLPLLQSIGANTIRTYDTVDLGSTLDSAAALGLQVIVGLELPKSTEDWFYSQDSLVAERAARYRALGARYSDHPALLLWCLGNELIFYQFLDWQFPRQYRRIFQALRQGDPHHPIGTAMANASDRALLNWGLKIPEIDLFIFNTFGRLPRLLEDLERYRWLWDGPYIVGEWGESGPWEVHFTPWEAPYEAHTTRKAGRIRRMHGDLPEQDPRYLGNLAFYWGQRQERTHTWFNFLDRQGRFSQATEALADLWGQPIEGNSAPRLDTFFLDGAREVPFLFSPGSLHHASVKSEDPDGDSLHYHWSLRPEDWFFRYAQAPAPVAEGVPWNKDSDTITPPGSGIQFKVPSKPGPYRLFVKITDGRGHFAAANMPFYVVSEP